MSAPRVVCVNCGAETGVFSPLCGRCVQAVKSAEDMAKALENAQAYVDDAAQFPEQFKPGVVKRHQQQVRDALNKYHGDEA